MGDLPRAINSSQPNRQTQAWAVVLCQLRFRATSQQGRGKRYRVASRNVQLDDVECAASFSLPSEKRGPCLSIGGDPAHNHRRRDIKHDHVIRMVRDDVADLLGADSRRPRLDQAANDGFLSLSADNHEVTPCAPGETRKNWYPFAPVSAQAPSRRARSPRPPCARDDQRRGGDARGAHGRLLPSHSRSAWPGIDSPSGTRGPRAGGRHPGETERPSRPPPASRFVEAAVPGRSSTSIRKLPWRGGLLHSHFGHGRHDHR